MDADKPTKVILPKAQNLPEPNYDPTPIFSPPPLDMRKATKIIELVGKGISTIRAAEQVGIDAFIFYIWKKKNPEFGQAISHALKSRAEILTEKLLETAMTELNKSTIDPKKYGTVLKIIERVTSIHDKDQNLRIQEPESKSQGVQIIINSPLQDDPKGDIDDIRGDDEN